MNLIKLLIVVFLTLSGFLGAIEKDRLLTFLKEYDASSEKKNWSWEKLPYAIENGYADVAEFLVLKGEPIKNYGELSQSVGLKNVYDIYYRHPILTAIRKNYVSLAILMIQTIKDISKVEEYKDIKIKTSDYPSYNCLEVERKHAIEVAITEGSHDILHILLLAGVKVNMQYSYRVDNPPMWPSKYFTPLKAAIALKKLDIAQLFLDHKADVEFCGSYYTTPLYAAVEDNYIDGVVLLLNYGANPLKPLSDGKTPLELAMQKGYWDIVDFLLDATVSDNKILPK